MTDDRAYDVVARLTSALPSGSDLVFSDSAEVDNVGAMARKP
ncbi:hypothetical protein ACQEU8_02935 [Streptomyces sp. CA-250714]